MAQDAVDPKGLEHYEGRRYDHCDPEAVDTAVLSRLSFDYPGTSTDVHYETSEFTSVCPWTGLPDFARLKICYRPHKHLVELKSLKYYLTSYRSVGILQEHAVNRILEDLVRLLDPRSMRVEAWFNERGGLTTYTSAAYPLDPVPSE